MSTIDPKTLAVAKTAISMAHKKTLTSASRWTKKAFARGADGYKVALHGDEATCFCMFGAVHRNIIGDGYISTDVIARLLGFDEAEEGFKWNDASGRTFDEVRQRLADAISKF